MSSLLSRSGRHEVRKEEDQEEGVRNFVSWALAGQSVVVHWRLMAHRLGPRAGRKKEKKRSGRFPTWKNTLTWLKADRMAYAEAELRAL